MNTVKKTIDSIMDNFNFDRVHTAMVVLNWQWDQIGVPEVEHLREAARNLLEQAADKETGWSVGSGGFEAINNGDHMRLEFTLEQWEHWHEGIVEGMNPTPN